MNYSIGFYTFCILLASAFFIKCLYLYIENESISLVEFKALGKRPEIDIYPSISLCPSQLGMINQSKLKEDNITQKASNYKSFLYGRKWNDQMANIDYDDYTIDLQNYLTKIKVEERGVKKQVLYEWTSTNTRLDEKDYGSEKSPLYISYRSDKDKCFTVDIDQDVVKRTKAKTIRAIIFEFSNMDTSNIGKSIMINIFIHYPRQLFRSLPTYKIKSSKMAPLEPKKRWVDEIKISNMVIIRRRNTWKEPCDEQWKQYDENILKAIAESVGCKPQFWKLEYGTIEICDSKEKMKESLIPPAYNLDSNLLERFPPPCNQLQVLTHETATTERNMTTYGTMTTGRKSNYHGSNVTRNIEIFFNLKYYQEVLQVQDFDFASLIGNAGGYIGMFLGVALWQLPEILGSCSMKIKNGLYRHA